MKKFLQITLLFVIIGAAGVIGLAYVSNHTLPAPQIFREIVLRNYLLGNKDKIEALSAGSSFSCSLDLNIIGYKGCDIWQLGMDLFETKSQLETYVPKLPNLKVVFMSLGFVTFHADNGAYNLTGRAPRRRLYYAVTPSFDILPGDLTSFNFIKGKLLPITRKDHWRGVYMALQNPEIIKKINKGTPKYLPPMLQSKRKQRIKSKEELSTMAIRQAFPYSQKKQIEMIKNHPDIHIDTFAALEGIIEFFQERDIRLILYTPPLYKTYAEIHKRKNSLVYNFMITAMKRLQKKYHIEYYDFSEANGMAEDNRFFFDCDHMNSNGTYVFSKTFRHVLEQD